MNVNNISTTSFEGKIYIDNKFTKPMRDYLDKVLDHEYVGRTARERIATKTYDINVWGHVTKKTIHPRFWLSSEFKVLKDKKRFDIGLTKHYFSKTMKLNTPISKNAEKLNLFLVQFERYKNEFDFSYNTFGEKIQAYFKRFFNIRK